MKFLAALLAALLPASAAAKSVIAHVIVGNTFSYTIDDWKAQITDAQKYGIDAFALNVATPFNGAGGCATQMSYAFQAANALNFKMFFMFDYLGGTQGPWPASDIKTIMNAYGPNGAMFNFNGHPLVSTFEGGDHLGDWPSIKSSSPGGITFIPNMMGLGPDGVANNLNTLDGFFSWDMWPHGPNDISTAQDDVWRSKLNGKPYMMGVSPWFYTKLPDYGKAWVWRGDDLWHQRWQQAATYNPELVQIVSWNDFGESHYIGPIVDAGVPSGANANAHPYVDNMPHTAWRELLPYYINQYKTGSTAVSTEKLVYWYRLTPASGGSDGGVTGNNCPSPINKFPSDSTCYAPVQLSRDKIFVTALVKSLPATITVQVGGNAAQSYQATSTGAFHISQDFNGQTGVVNVKLSHNGNVALNGNGAAIQANPSGGVTNWNAWVGSA